MTDHLSDPVNVRKRSIREAALARRAALSPSERAERSRRIRERLLAHPAVLRASRIFTFVSFDTEVDTHGVIDALLADGRHVAVPRILDDSTIRAVPMTSWDDLEAGRWGILSPRSDTPAAGPFDVAVIPGVGFTEQGGRIGHGRGYYDRWLAENPVETTVALAFECQILPELPLEPHDRPVDVIATEARLLEPGL
ncbi:5-formyltetrahydrofolate cyclo-ligase [Aquisalimonas asiatica]|uniref:5-formyltetrahydrofolate cyclo-ligase n=1 Tax=Aquisalimonas asiatica TaxID=406100 RepID=A0A1H8Q3N4_9GAMM|nr:5-formyltetrahydrofolate cyclo-ligase [Aquisalimonas asiatica]SEO48676.1 5-formyltetrahydrofolate cyclo-ligase [Aquisalimonas asiatica]